MVNAMKKLLTTLLIFAGTLIYGQSHKTYERVSDNLIKTTTFEGGRISQTGYYTIMGSELLKHGEWRLYSNGKVTSRAKFHNNQLVWVDTSDGRITADQIKIRKLERKVVRLEKLIASQP
jgi:antitoxin component YwqK of YwqJK toxin-antitoxin module